MRKAKISVLHLCMFMSVVIAFAGISSAALFSKSVTTQQQPTQIKSFDVNMSWGGALFADKIGPSSSGQITLNVSGSADVPFNIIIELASVATNWELADDIEYIPLDFMILQNNQYLQTDGSYSPNKQMYGLNDLTHIVIASVNANVSIDTAFVVAWEWNADREITDLYVCDNEALGVFNVGDIITEETLFGEEYEDFVLASASDVDMYLASKAETQTLTITPTAIAIEVT